MKKNLIALMTVTAILASSGAVFADADINVPAQPDTNFETEIQGDVMLISENPEDAEVVAAPVMMPSYISNTVTVTEVGEGTIASKTEAEAETDSELENVINFTTDETTLVFSANGEKKSLEDVKADSVITVFTSSYAAVPMILPPQYPASVIIINDEEAVGIVNVDTYLEDGEMLVNAANSLALNISEETEIVDTEGNAVEADKLVNNDLIVFYSISTRSIPAQTTPEKVVVLGENEMALASIEAIKNEAAATPAPEATEAPVETEAPVDYSKVTTVNVEEETLTNVYVKEDGTFMLPLRKIAETLGLTVEWDGETKSVMINSGIYSLQIGVNSYVKGRMVPMELKAAPEITEDLTYVPVEYFTDVIEAAVEVNEETLSISNVSEDASTEVSE